MINTYICYTSKCITCKGETKANRKKSQSMGSNYEEIPLPKPSPPHEENACLSAMLLSFSPIVYSAVLKASLELKLFEIIAKTTPPAVSASEIASQLPIQHKKLPQRLDRMLSLLASYSLLTCSTRTKEDGGIERLYQLSPVGKYFVKDQTTGSVAMFSRFMSQPSLIDAL